MLTINPLKTVSRLSMTVPPRAATAVRADACNCRTVVRRAAMAVARAPGRSPRWTAATAAGAPERSQIYRAGTTWANVADAESIRKRMVFIEVIPHAAGCRRAFLRDAADCHRRGG